MVSYYEYDEDDFPDVIVLPDDYDWRYDDEDAPPERIWTLRRLLYLFIALMMIAAMVVAYDLLPAVQFAAESGSNAVPTPAPPPPALA